VVGRPEGRGPRCEACAAARSGGCGTGARGPFRTAWMAGEGIRPRAAFSIPQRAARRRFPRALATGALAGRRRGCGRNGRGCPTRRPVQAVLGADIGADIGEEASAGVASMESTGSTGVGRAAGGGAGRGAGRRSVEARGTGGDGRSGRGAGWERTARPRPAGSRSVPRTRGDPRCEPDDGVEWDEVEPIWRSLGIYRPLERDVGGLGPGPDRSRRGPGPALVAGGGRTSRPNGPGGRPARPRLAEGPSRAGLRGRAPGRGGSP
jgi:hypothetical protein